MAEPTVDTPRVNGNVTSWGHIVYKLKGQRFYGAVELTYGEKRERVEGTGLGAAHVATRKSAGKYTCEVSKVKFFKASASALRAALAAEAEDGVSYGNVEFEGVLQFIAPDETPMQVEQHRCTYQSNAANHSESADPLYDEVEIKPMYLVINGKCLFDATEGLP